MASVGTKMSTPVAMALVIIMTTLWGGTVAQTGCTTTLMGLASCLNYISGSSTTPSPPCCSQLSSVVQSQPQCLCQVLNGRAPSIGITINQTQAMSLPGACKIQTPPVSLCKAVNQPAASPVGSPTTPAASPVGSPTTSPADASNPQDSAVPGSPTTPPSTVSSVPAKGARSKSIAGSTSDGSMTKFSFPLTLFLVFITSSAAVITRM